MAESDRPTPDTQSDETPDLQSAADDSAIGEVRLADGTLVGGDSSGATADEMDDLLTLFEDELARDPGDDPATGMTEQEAAEEDLLQQAEALLGTTDPRELEELAQVHRVEAGEQHERLSQVREQLAPATPAEPAAEAVESPDEAEAPPVQAVEVPDTAADEVAAPVAEVTTTAEEEAAALDETLALLDEEPAAQDATREDAPPEPAPEVADEVEPAGEAEAPPAPAVEVPDPVANEGAEPEAEVTTTAEEDAAAIEEALALLDDEPAAQDVAEADAPSEPEAAEAPAPTPAATAEPAAAKVTAEPTPAAEAAPEAEAEADDALALGVAARTGHSSLRSRLAAALVSFVQASAMSKGRLATAAGLLAMVAAYAGFALFEARFTSEVLRRRFPDAVGASDLQYYQAVSEVEAGAFARARQRLRPLRANPDGVRDADVLFALAEAYFLDAAVPTNLRYSQARGLFLDAIVADPTHPHVAAARRRIAETYRGQYMWPEAEDAYRLLLERYQIGDDSAPTHYALGEVQLADGRAAQAAETFERVWNEFPDAALAPAARLRHGDALAALGRETDAQRFWTPLAGAETPAAVRWEAVTRLADAAERAGDTRAAVAWWDTWLRGAPDTRRQAEVLLKFADLTAQVGDPEASVASLEYLIAAYPKHPAAVDAALRRGAALEAAEQTQEARELYADALVAAPEDARLLVAMGRALTAEGNTERALELVKRAAAADPASAAAQLRLAQAYSAADQPGRAMKVYWEMLPRHPLAPETQTAVNELVTLLQADGYTTEAYRVVDLYSTIAVDGPSRAAMHEAKAQLLVGLDLWEDAERELTAAVSAQPSPRVQLALAAAQVRTRNWAGVIETAARIDTSALSDAQAVRMLALQTQALLQSGRAQEAAVLLAVKTDRTQPLPLRLRGLEAEALMRMGDTAQARERMTGFDASLEADAPLPEDLAPTYLAWAEHLYAQHIFSRAVQYYARVDGEVFGAHDRAWAAYQVGNCYSQLQDYAQAAAAYERMIAAHPQAPWVPFAREKAQFAQLQASAALRGSRT